MQSEENTPGSQQNFRRKADYSKAFRRRMTTISKQDEKSMFECASPLSPGESISNTWSIRKHSVQDMDKNFFRIHHRKRRLKQNRRPRSQNKLFYSNGCVSQTGIQNAIKKNEMNQKRVFKSTLRNIQMHADYQVSPGLKKDNRFGNRRLSCAETIQNGHQGGPPSGPISGLHTAISSLMSSLDDMNPGQSSAVQHNRGQ